MQQSNKVLAPLSMREAFDWAHAVPKDTSASMKGLELSPEGKKEIARLMEEAAREIGITVSVQPIDPRRSGLVHGKFYVPKKVD